MKKIILTGKAWEILFFLKQYGEEYEYVEEWIDSLLNKEE